MSQNTAILHVGLDVAKLSLQLHLAGRFHSLVNDPKGHAQLLKLLRSHPGAHVICEATGGYEQRVVQTLQAADLPVSIVEAGRVRYFARAQGLRAKTDPIDAAVLTDYGTTFKPTPTPGLSAQQQRLAAIAQRRRQLIHSRTMETNRADHYTDPLCVRQHRQFQKLLEKQIDQCDQAIADLIAADANLAQKAKRLEAIPGSDRSWRPPCWRKCPNSANSIPRPPPPWQVSPPITATVEKLKGRRHISGGRRPVRCALYMATLSAVRYDRILKAFYTRLRAAGKKPLVAMTACMRKLVVLMNHLLKNEKFQLAS